MGGGSFFGRYLLLSSAFANGLKLPDKVVGVHTVYRAPATLGGGGSAGEHGTD